MPSLSGDTSYMDGGQASRPAGPEERLPRCGFRHSPASQRAGSRRGSRLSLMVIAAKVHPAEGLTGDQLAREMDQIDARLRSELPEIGEVFIDVTQHSRRDSR